MSLPLDPMEGEVGSLCQQDSLAAEGPEAGTRSSGTVPCPLGLFLGQTARADIPLPPTLSHSSSRELS